MVAIISNPSSGLARRPKFCQSFHSSPANLKAKGQLQVHPPTLFTSSLSLSIGHAYLQQEKKQKNPSSCKPTPSNDDIRQFHSSSHADGITITIDL